jgi:quinol monooxygenase YgiN
MTQQLGKSVVKRNMQYEIQNPMRELRERSMVITTIRMIIPRDKRQEILQTVSSLAGTIRKERGCRRCDFYVDIENTDAFLLIEEWDSPENFDGHVRAAPFSALLGAFTLLSDRPDVRISSVNGIAGMERIKAARTADVHNV